MSPNDAPDNPSPAAPPAATATSTLSRRRRLQIALLSALIAGLVRALAWTWRVDRAGRAPAEAALGRGPVVFAFLHGEQLPLIATQRDMPAAGMASLSKDGELLARCIARLGFAVVRGSSSRGGGRAMSESQAAIERGLSPALAVDGPRGPRGVPKPGAAALAIRNQIPVACFRADVSRALRLGSWDRFCVPWPFARVVIRVEVLPPGDDLDALSAEIQRALADPSGAAAAS